MLKLTKSVIACVAFWCGFLVVWLLFLCVCVCVFVVVVFVRVCFVWLLLLLFLSFFLFFFFFSFFFRGGGGGGAVSIQMNKLTKLAAFYNIVAHRNSQKAGIQAGSSTASCQQIGNRLYRRQDTGRP